MEAALRWSPHSTHDASRFMVVDVVGNRLRLCQIDELEKKTINYREIAQRQQLPNFTAFDWSKTNDNLVAIGLATGEAALLRIDGDRSHTGDINAFPIKHQRKCNTISFSTQNLLATGLDRVRNDFSMNIYDLSAGSWTSSQEPYLKLSSSEAIMSIKYFTDQPDTLLAGVSRLCVRLYDLRDHSGMGATQFSTRNVHNISIDPLDENYFITAGPHHEPAVSLWDRRFVARPSASGSSDPSSGGAVLEMRPAIDNSMPATIWSLRYSGTKRGCFGILSSTGEVKIVELAQHSMKLPHQLNPPNQFGSGPSVSPHYTRMTHNLRSPWQLRHGPQESTRVVSVDFVGGNIADDTCMLALLLNHKVEPLIVPKTPSHMKCTAMDEFVLHKEKPWIVQHASPKWSISEELLNLQRIASQKRSDSVSQSQDWGSASGSMSRNTIPDRDTRKRSMSGSISLEGHEKLLSLGFPEVRFGLADLTKVLSLQRRRCQEGYLFDCRRNQSIVSNDPWLVSLWNIVKRLELMAKDDGMVHDNIDLSYLGVCAIWDNELFTRSSRNRTFGPTENPSNSRVRNAIIKTSRNQEFPSYSGTNTAYPDHRQLCLAISGWKFSAEELRIRCQELMARKNYYRAIVLAVFHGRKDVALDLLKQCIQSKGLENIGLGAVIACETVNEQQRELCAWMAEESDDPYLRALLSYFVSGNWSTVLEMKELSLADRVGVALQHLEDRQIGPFLAAVKSRAIADGDIDGIVLTGLGEAAVDLLQNYISKTNDLQTAILVLGITNPLYVSDIRWEVWKETYFMQMQAWRLFTERTRFIVQHNRRAITRDGRELNKVPPRPVSLRCHHCLGNLARRDRRSGLLEGTNYTSYNDSKSARALGASAGIVCPRCGRHMPRCGICMMRLGTPDPSKPSGSTLSEVEDLMAKFITFCMNCNHGFHGHHARDWFAKHQMCPVPDCQCSCGLRH